MLQPQVSIANQVNLARIGHNKFGSPKVSLPDKHANYGVGSGGVTTNREDAFGITYIIDGVGHSPTAECRDQTGHSGGMSETSTMVNVICAQYRPGKFLHYIVIFIGALS